MNEIMKPNDILVSTLVNGQTTIPELISNNITAENTQLMGPEFYKNTKAIQKQFSDDKGNFNESAFLQVYEKAAQQYSELLDVQTYQNLEKYIEYNQNDIFAPLTSKKSNISYEIQPEKNPSHRSHGVSSLFEYGQATQSMRELAQQSKIWDSENQVWLDKTAEDRGLLGSIFGQSLVYATWDEDGEHEDILTGRKIKHKKGDWKLNDKGQYYTETLGSRSGHGKQFVAASDTLTKEGSALNTIDVFDSDDLEKSVVGTTMKAALKIAPLIFPPTQIIWGGAAAAINMAKALPKFLKMTEGIIMGGDADKETSFTRAMNKWDNYFSKFEKSRSDKGQNSNWSYEAIADIVTDTFSQLYQMRAAASLSQLAIKDPTKQALRKFENEILPKVINGVKDESSMSTLLSKAGEISAMAVQKMPEVKAAIEAQSKLSRAISSAYMAITSTSDVYEDALAGGYDRRTAGFAGLAATVGQYSLMRYTDLGSWMLDKNVGYSEHANRATIMKALRPYYKDISEAVDKIGQAGTKQEKGKLLGKVIGKLQKSLDSVWNSIKEDGSVYWRNALTESIEEMSEEAVLDATKGVFDFLSWAGFGKNKNASFGIAEDFTSGAFLERYAQAAFGGFLGGALFEVQQKKIDPMMRRVLYGQNTEEVQPSLIHEIANGRTADVMRAIDELSALDKESASTTQTINGKQYFTSANGGMTRGQAVGEVLKSYVKVLEGLIVDENADLSDTELIQKSIRDVQAIELITKGGLDKMLISDFSKLASDIVSLRQQLEVKQEDKSEDKKEENKDKKESAKTKQLAEQLEEKRKELQDFLSGKKGEYYLYKTLVGATPEAKAALGDLSLYDYTYLKYGKQFKDLSKKGSVTQKSVQEEYNKWKEEQDSTKRYITLGVEAYSDFDSRFSKYILDFAESQYKDVRRTTYDKLMSQGNFNITHRDDGIIEPNGVLDKDFSYRFIRSVANALKQDAKDNPQAFGQVTLQDIFKQDELKLQHTVANILDQNEKYVQLLMMTGKTKQEIAEGLQTQIKSTLESVNIDSLEGLGLGALLNTYFQESLDKAFDIIMQQLPNKTLGELQQWMLDNGYLDAPMAFTEEALASTEQAFLKDQFLKNIGIDVSNASVGLSTSLVQEYLASQDTIDGTIAQRIAEHAANAIIAKLQGMSAITTKQSEDADNNDFYLFKLVDAASQFEEKFYWLHSGVYKELIDAINNQFGTKPIKEIVKEWAQNNAIPTVESTKEFIANFEFADIETKHGLSLEDVQQEDKIEQLLESIILPAIESVPEYQIYKSLESKSIKQNPIFDSLSKIDLYLSESGPSKVLEILKAQHYKLRKAERFEDYLPKGEEKIQLENALRAIAMYKALLTGMNSGPLSFGNPFGINQQMSRFLEKNGLKSEKEYKTIDKDSADLIYNDLELIEQQIRGYLKLGEKAYSNKKDEDIRIKKEYSKQLLAKINEKAQAFTIDDFSLLPNDSEKAKFKEPDEVLALYAHTVYTKFNDRFKTPEEKAAAIKQLATNLKLVGQFDRTSKPTNLTKDVDYINEYDELLWLATALGADTNEFYYRYNALFVGAEKSNLVPLYSQEMAALQAWSFLRSKNNVKGSDGKLISVHQALLDECLTKDGNYVKVSNIFLTNGITGAGKTTAVGKIVSQLCSDKIGYVTAANSTQQQKYYESLQKGHPEKDLLQTGSVWDLIGKFITKEGKAALQNQIKFSRKSKGADYIKSFSDRYFKQRDAGDFFIWELDREVIKSILKKDVDLKTIPEVIYIDEATQLDTWTFQLLDFLGSEYGFKIYASGDTTQRGLSQFGDSQVIKDLFLWKSAKLNLSIRSANSQKSNNNVIYNSLLEVYEDFTTENPDEGKKRYSQFISQLGNHQTVSYYQDSESFAGDKFVESLKDAKEDIEHVAKLAKKDKSKIIIITKLKEDNQPVDSSLIPMLSDAGLVSGDYELFSSDDVHDKAVQGQEANYVIVDGSYLSELQTANEGEILRSVYTFASRSLKGTLMELPMEVQKKIGLINRKDRFTQIDEIPQLAELSKIKAERKKSLDAILSGYTPKEVTLKQLKTEEIDGKKVAVRHNVKSNSGSTKTSVTVSQTNVEGTPEHELTETEQEEVDSALNTEIQTSPVNPIQSTDATEKRRNAERINIAVNYAGPYVGKENKKTTSRVYSALDHLGIPLIEGTSNMWDSSEDSGTCLDLDGLCALNRPVMSQTRTGFENFKNAVLAANSKQDIVDIIASDQYVAAFLFEAAPMVAQRVLGTADVDWQSPEIRRVYASWFKESVEIDDNYFVFAKKLDWKKDRPFNTANANKDDSVQDGNTVLYLGIKLKSKEPDTAESQLPIFHQYISLGTVADRIIKKGQRANQPVDSEALKRLYDQADKDLRKDNTPLVVYRLPSTKMYNLRLSSTLWVRKIESDGGEDMFESIAQMERRGFTINKNHIYLVDSTKVDIGNGRYEYKALVLAAMLGYTASDIDPKTGDPLTFEQRLEKLKAVFVNPDTNELNISGSYMALAQSTKMASGNQEKLKAYQRLVFLNPKKSNIKDILGELKHKVQLTSKNEIDWRNRLQKCRPASQTRIIADILQQVGVFDNTEHDSSESLKKYLLGWSHMLHSKIGDKNIYNNDKKALEELISWVDQKQRENSPIDKDQFLEKMSSLKHRALLVPFVFAFIEFGDAYIKIKDLKRASVIKVVSGIPTYNDSGLTLPYVKLNLDDISDGYACPPLVRGGNEDYPNVLKAVMEGPNQAVLKKDLPEDFDASKLDFNMYRVPYTDDIRSLLGMYGYELQSPTYTLTDDELNIDFERDTVEYPFLEKAEPQHRWPARKGWNRIPVKPDGFDPSKYRPEKLTSEQFIVDSKYGFVIYKETKKKDKDGKTVEKEVELVKHPKYKKYVDAAKFPKIKGKKKKVKRAVKEKSFNGYSLPSTDGKQYHFKAINVMGFDVRIGDIVQLWGDPTKSAKIVGLNLSDPNNRKIVVGYVGDGSGQLSDKLDHNQEVPLDAVTKVLFRTVQKAEHIKLDYYTKGVFKTENPLEEERFEEPSKTMETMEELISGIDEGGYSKFLDFDNYYYAMVPIHNMPSVEKGRLGAISLLEGLPDQPRGTITIVDNIADFANWHDDIKDDVEAQENEGLQGYTVYRFRRDTYDGYNDPQKFIADRVKPDIIESLQKGKIPGYIQHFVFFDEENAKSVQYSIERAHASTIYDHNKTSKRFTKPSDLPIGLGKEWNFDEIVNFTPNAVPISKSEWDNRGSAENYPEGEFLRQLDDNGDYLLYPSPDFYFARKKKKVNGKSVDEGPKYGVSVNGSITYHEWEKFIYMDSKYPDPQAVAGEWSGKLSGLKFIDRQYGAYDETLIDPTDKKNNGLKKSQAAKRKVLPKSIAYSNTGEGVDAQRIITIQKVFWDVNSQTYKISYTGPALVLTTAQGDDALSIQEFTIPLTSFFIQFGSRFRILRTQDNQIRVTEGENNTTVKEPEIEQEIIAPVKKQVIVEESKDEISSDDIYDTSGNEQEVNNIVLSDSNYKKEGVVKEFLGIDPDAQINQGDANDLKIKLISQLISKGEKVSITPDLFKSILEAIKQSNYTLPDILAAIGQGMNSNPSDVEKVLKQLTTEDTYKDEDAKDLLIDNISYLVDSEYDNIKEC